MHQMKRAHPFPFRLMGIGYEFLLLLFAVLRQILTFWSIFLSSNKLISTVRVGVTNTLTLSCFEPYGRAPEL